MNYSISITMDNAAFEESPDVEVNWILTRLKARIYANGLENEVPLLDSNGNRVGIATLSQEA